MTGLTTKQRKDFLNEVSVHFKLSDLLEDWGTVSLKGKYFIHEVN